MPPAQDVDAVGAARQGDAGRLPTSIAAALSSAWRLATASARRRSHSRMLTASRSKRGHQTASTSAGRAASAKHCRPAADQRVERIWRARIADGRGEQVQDVVEQRAALGRTRIAHQRVERRQAKNAPGIDGVGVAAQRLDLGDAEAARPDGHRRLRLGPGGEIGLLAGIERAGPADQSCSARPQGGGMVGAGIGKQPLQPARRHRRRVAGARRARQHDLSARPSPSGNHARQGRCGAPAVPGRCRSS